MKDDYSKSRDLLCGTCGGGDFEFEDEDGPFRCVGCNREYPTNDSLIADNQARIDREVDEIGSRIVKDLQSDLTKAFKKLK